MATAAAKNTPADSAEEAKNLPAVQGSSNVPDFLQDSIDADAGLGLSTDAADNIVPLLYVLQSNSPQVQRGNAAQVKGAKPGDLWIKGSEEAFDGETGVEIQPCAFYKDWVEWTPRSKGGGFVQKHDTCPADAREQQDDQGRTRLVRPNGNEMVETRYHFGLINGGPVVVPFSSTGHTVSRDWMNKMNNIRTANKRSAPSFASMWLLKTVQRTNNSGSWYVIKPEHVGWVPSMDDYNLGKALSEQVSSGALKADTDVEQGGGAGSGETFDPNTGEVTQSTSAKADPRNKGEVPF